MNNKQLLDFCKEFIKAYINPNRKQNDFNECINILKEVEQIGFERGKNERTISNDSKD